MLHACRSLCLRGKAIVISWSHVTIDIMDLTWLGLFHILTDPASRSWLSHQSSDVTNLPIKLLDQPFGSTFWINFLNQSTQSTFSLNWRCNYFVVHCFLWQTYVRRRIYSYLLRYIWFRWLTFLQITYLSRRKVYQPWVSLSGGVDESSARRS